MGSALLRPKYQKEFDDGAMGTVTAAAAATAALKDFASEELHEKESQAVGDDFFSAYGSALQSQEGSSFLTLPSAGSEQRITRICKSSCSLHPLLNDSSRIT